MEVLANAVYAGADADDLDELADHYDKCPRVSASGIIRGRKVDMVTETTVVEVPELDADAALAVDVSVTSATLPAVPQRMIFMVEGEYGAYVSAVAESGSTTSKRSPTSCWTASKSFSRPPSSRRGGSLLR